MKKTFLKHAIRTGLLASLTLTLAACGGSSDSNNDSAQAQSLGMPADLSLVLVNANTGAYHLFNTSDETLTNLNKVAKSSQDSSVQALEITDTSVLGSLFAWPDFREVNGEEVLDNKYLLMNPSYTSGNAISSADFVQLAHFHDDALAAHTAAEFEDPEPGSSMAEGLARLNAHVASQVDLESELAAVLPAGETLCQAYVDPYVAFEMTHEEGSQENTETEAAHEHGELVHIALTTEGKIHFFVEGEAGLESLQGFVQLDDVSMISDCSRASVARASEEGALFFIPDSQTIYLVDSHGGDYHQHSRWAVSSILGEGGRADMMVVLGGGAEHDHE